METKYFQFSDAEFKANDTERTIKHYISTVDIDWGGDIMLPKGMDTKMYDKGARTVFYNHLYHLPVGKNMWLKKEDNGVLAKTYFAKSTLFADDIYNLHKEGVLASWSIGFQPLHKNGEMVKDAIEFDEKTKTTKYHKWSLIEYSDAPLPMNPGCLDQAKSIVQSLYFKQIINDTETQMAGENYIETMQEDIKELANKYIALKNYVEENQKAVNDIINSTQNLIKELEKNISMEAVVDKEKILQSIIDGAVSRVIINNN